ncbi:MAG: hypothetical protein DYG92_06640 [Leptolyngbya sp. PLA1]|nr:hypothetical protein [Leptolyngbya sp. PLA1]
MTWSVRAALAMLGAAVSAIAHGQVVLQGDAQVFGLASPATIAFDATGRVVTHVAGRVRLRSGFDGTRAWSDDLGTPPRTLHLRERDEVRLLGAVLSGTWDDPHGPLVLADGPLAEGGPAEVAFTFRDGRPGGTISLDASGRPVAMRLDAAQERGETRLSEWTRVGEVWAPMVVERSGGGGSVVMRFKPDGATRPDLSSFAAPEPTARAAFEGDARLEVKRAKTGHLLVKPRIDGREVGWFIFDTGAGATVLDKATASELGVEQFGSIPVGGIGGYVTSPLSMPKAFTLGPATIHSPVLITLDLAPIGAAIGEDLAGIVGYDLLSRVISEIDLARARISLHDPRAFDAGGAEWSPLIVYERHPCVKGAIEGHEGILKLDTGANPAIMVTAPTVRRLGLLDGRETSPTRIGGSGGFREAAKGVLRSVSFAGTEVKDVQAVMALPDDEGMGALRDDGTMGSLGGPLLRRGVLVLDYLHERMMLRPASAE